MKIITTVAILAVVISVVLGYSNWKYAGSLANARAAAEQAVKHAKQAESAGLRAIIAAKADSARADSAEKRAEAHAARQNWKPAYEEQVKATVALKAQIDTLKPALAQALAVNSRLMAATTTLIKTNRRSFWDKIVPKVGVGVGAGLTVGGGVGVVVGPTLSWTL